MLKSCWQKNQICRKQLRVKKHLTKQAETKIVKAEQEINQRKAGPFRK